MKDLLKFQRNPKESIPKLMTSSLMMMVALLPTRGRNENQYLLIQLCKRLRIFSELTLTMMILIRMKMNITQRKRKKMMNMRRIMENSVVPGRLDSYKKYLS